MSFDSQSIIAGRQPATILELDLDSCANVYGTSPCTATLARTNAVRESQTFGVGATWAPFNATVTVEQQVAPDGTVTADALIPDDFVTSEVKELLQPLNLTILNTVQQFTVSCYFQTTGTDIRLMIQTNSIKGAFVDVNLTNGQIVDRGNLDGGTAAPFVAARCFKSFGFIDNPSVSADWWRVELVFMFGNLTVPIVRFGLIEKDTNNDVYVGSLGQGVYMWGAQLREGDGAGIYAPTTTLIEDGMGTVDDICFNTFGTCQDTPNYVKEVKTYSFIDTLETPIEISNAFPAITPNGVKYTPTRLQPGGDLSLRGKVTINLQDFTHNDGGGPSVPSALGDVVDKYFRLRTYNPADRGTFFGKLKARNEFYVGRPMRVLEGYIDQPFTLANFRTREYIIEEIRGPDRNGRVQIIGKDVLSLAINNRAKAPAPSVGTVAVAMNSVVGSMTVSAGTGSDYDVDTHVRVDSEIMEITNRAADVLTVTREAGGTTAADHAIGAQAQSCLTYDDLPVIDVILDLLKNFANVSTAFIPFAEWEQEEAASLSGYDMTTIISEPTGVTKLLKEIMEITLIDLWYSDVDQEIFLKLETPFTDVTIQIDDQSEIVENSLVVKDVQEKRLTRVLIWYGAVNFAEDLTEPSNYSLGNFEIEADKEGVNKFDDERTKVIFSRWFDGSNTTQVQLTSQRLLARFGRVPQELTFDIDAKDVNRFDTGDVIDISSRIIQDFTGADKVDRFQIIETQPKSVGSIYRYKALAFFLDPISQGPTVIDANQTCLDLFVELGGPPGPVEVTVTINAGVIIDATKVCPALTTGALHPDSIITIINNGTIRGYSGNGGNGGLCTVFCLFSEFTGTIITNQTQPGDPGQPGGDAIDVTIGAMFIDNTGTGNIFGGGGGAGGGAGGFRSGFNRATGGGGGGGGRGSDGVGCAGDGGLAQGSGDFGCPPTAVDSGDPGTDGDETAAGAGGAGGDSGGFTIAGDGGLGGDWGAAGSPGDATVFPMFVLAGGGGGAAGFAVRKNGNTVTFLGGNNPTQVKGLVA